VEGLWMSRKWKRVCQNRHTPRDEQMVICPCNARLVGAAGKFYVLLFAGGAGLLLDGGLITQAVLLVLPVSVCASPEEPFKQSGGAVVPAAGPGLYAWSLSGRSKASSVLSPVAAGVLPTAAGIPALAWSWVGTHGCSPRFGG